MSEADPSDVPVRRWWVPMLGIIGAAVIAVGGAMLGATLVVDKPRSVFYDDIEPRWEGIAGIERLDPRALPSCHYRVTTLHKEVVKVERIGPWEIERGVVGWRTLELRRNGEGAVDQIEVFDDDHELVATEEIRREGKSVFVASGDGVEERVMDADGRIHLIRERDAAGEMTGAAALERDPQGRVTRRKQHLPSGGVQYDAVYEYGDERFGSRATTETVRKGLCAKRTTTFDDAGRRQEVSCFDRKGTPKADPASGCDVVRYRYAPGERTHVCIVGDRATPGEPVRY